MKQPKNYSKAYRRFQLIIDRTKRLLKATVRGIDHELNQSKPLIEKFTEAKKTRGRIPKNYVPHFNIEKTPNEETFTVEMDDRVAVIIKEALEFGQKNTEELQSHHNSIMLVYVWGAFETYFFMLFEELFTKKTEMLKTSESISFKTAIENKDNIVQYLIQNELERIGHFSLEEYLKYLEKKVSLSFPKAMQDRLKKNYLIRNIVAHNTGIVAPRLRKQLTQAIKVKNDELLISSAYIESEVKFIESVVLKIEKHIDSKFNKNEV